MRMLLPVKWSNQVDTPIVRSYRPLGLTYYYPGTTADKDEELIGTEQLGYGGEIMTILFSCPTTTTATSGELDRDKLGQLVFTDKSLRAKLNLITHPIIMATIIQRILTTRLFKANPLAVLDAPLLFESGVLQHLCYPIIVVSCPPEVQLKRLIKRNGLKEEDAKSRINSQMALSAKVAKADVVVDNSSSTRQLETRVKEAWAEVRACLGVKTNRIRQHMKR